MSPNSLVCMYPLNSISSSKAANRNITQFNNVGLINDTDFPWIIYNAVCIASSTKPPAKPNTILFLILSELIQYF